MASPQIERVVVRVLVATALAIALWACSQVPIPRDGQGDPDLPAVAIEQVGLYRLEVALLTFYGVLLLVTPAYSGLTRGRLPTEISTRGAKFADEIDQQAELAAAAVKRLEQVTAHLADELGTANKEIKYLKQRAGDDT